MPIREIKIDRSFVMNMREDANDEMIVRATSDLGRNLGLRVVAEGVEDAVTRDLLASLGCDEAQGFLFSYPLPAGEFEPMGAVAPSPSAEPEDSLTLYRP